jgi:hypothetical protein
MDASFSDLLPARAATSFQRPKPKGFARAEALRKMAKEIKADHSFIVEVLEAAGVFEK